MQLKVKIQENTPNFPNNITHLNKTQAFRITFSIKACILFECLH